MPSGQIVIPVTRTINVMGVSMGEGGKTADVTYNVIYKFAPFAGNAQLTTALLKAANYSAAPPQPGEKTFQKFDDGWRVVTPGVF